MSFDNELSSKNGSLSLPAEILVEIFSLCLPSDHIRLSTHPQLLPPFTLAQVCSQWRYLILSTPRLWSHIVLGHHGMNSSKEVSTFEFWLQRTGTSQPLDILLDPQADDALDILLNEEACATYERETAMLIEKFCANSQRWRSLVLDVLSSSVLDPLFGSLSTLYPNGLATAPLLQELELTTTLLGSSEDTRILHNFAVTCPQLRSLTLTCPMLLPVPVGARDFSVLENMRVLRLRFCTDVSNALAWIDICPNLECFKVHLLCQTNIEEDNPEIGEFDGLDEEIEDDGDLNDGGWVIVNSPSRAHAISQSGIGSVQATSVRRLAHLTQLEIITFSTAAPVGKLLDSLSTPSLRSLKISSVQARVDPLNARWIHVPLLLHRSDMPPIEELEINGVPMNTDDMRATLALVPRLRKLTIGWFQELDGLLQEMKARDHQTSGMPGQNEIDSILCPHLETLNVAEAYFSVDVLASMVSSRCMFGRGSPSVYCKPVVVGLKELCVRENAKEEIVRHPIIAGCVAQGLNVIESEPLLSFRVR